MAYYLVLLALRQAGAWQGMEWSRCAYVLSVVSPGWWKDARTQLRKHLKTAVLNHREAQRRLVPLSRAVRSCLMAFLVATALCLALAACVLRAAQARPLQEPWGVPQPSHMVRILSVVAYRAYRVVFILLSSSVSSCLSYRALIVSSTCFAYKFINIPFKLTTSEWSASPYF